MVTEKDLRTVIRVVGVALTTNAAEGAMRPGVLWRKGSFGTQSVEGTRFVTAMMVVVTTLKQQCRTVLSYLAEAGQAVYTVVPAPSFLARHTEVQEDLLVTI